MTTKSQTTLSRIAEVKQQIKEVTAQYEERLAPIQAEFAEKLGPLQLEETELRETLEQTMKSRGIKTQIDEASNTVATIVERTELKIVDPDAAVVALRERNALERCIKLDANAVKREYKTEPLAGVEEVQNSFVQIKEAVA